MISEAVLGKRPATEAEILEMLSSCVEDPDTFVRSQCVGTVATILTMGALPAAPAGLEWTGRLTQVAEALRPVLDKATADPEARVRVEAWRGIIGPIAYRNPRAALPPGMVRRLAAAYDRDESPQIRALAVQATQHWDQSDDPEARRLGHRLLLSALQDRDPYVVQAAAHAATTSRSPEALPLLVNQLKNPSYVARMGVAQGIASYRAAARPYLAELEAALAAETHDITRKTLEGTISVIRN